MHVLSVVALPLVVGLRLKNSQTCGKPHPLPVQITLAGNGRNKTHAIKDEGADDVIIGAYYNTDVERCEVRLIEERRSPPPTHGEFGPSPIEAVKNSPVDLSKLRKSFHPKIFIVAGLPRTGSTTLTMLVQIWLMLADPKFTPCRREGRTIEPYHRYVSQKAVEKKKEKGISIVIKAHKILPWMMGIVDTVFMSHRIPLEEMVSMSLAWNSKGVCSRLMDEQREVYRTAKECCGGVTYDMQLEQLIHDQARVIKDVALAMGIGKDALTPKLLNYVLELFVQNLPQSEDTGIQANQHWHSEEEKAKVRDDIRNIELTDPDCKKWNKQNGTSNDKNKH